MIICTKEVSVGARKNAYSLLVEIGNAFVRFCGNKKGDALFLNTCKFVTIRFAQHLTLPASNVDAMEEYLALVYVGLTGSVTMITCTVLALTRLVFEFKGRPHLYVSAWTYQNMMSVHQPPVLFFFYFSLRLYRGLHYGAAAAEHLRTALISYQGGCQSCLGLHQSHSLHHGPQSSGLTCHHYGMNLTLL